MLDAYETNPNTHSFFIYHGRYFEQMKGSRQEATGSDYLNNNAIFGK